MKVEDVLPERAMTEKAGNGMNLPSVGFMLLAAALCVEVTEP
jgi:hypothetical protein